MCFVVLCNLFRSTQNTLIEQCMSNYHIADAIAKKTKQTSVFKKLLWNSLLVAVANGIAT